MKLPWSKLLTLFSTYLTSGKRKRSNLEAVAQRCSVKKVFLEISQNLQEITCVSFLIQLQGNFPGAFFWAAIFRGAFFLGAFFRTSIDPPLN